MAESHVQQKRREFKVFSWAGAALVAAIFIGLNYIVSFLPLRLDLSAGGAYSISRGSKEILRKLDDTLTVKVMFSEQLPPVYKLNEKYLTDLLFEYRRASGGKIHIEYMDPSRSQKDKSEALSSGVAPVQLDVRERDRREVKECFMGVAFYYGDKREAISVVQDTDNLEYEISVRIKRLIDPTKLSIGVVTNGEAETMASKSLESLASPLRELYDIQEIDLTQPRPLPVKALWIIGPAKPFDAPAMANLRAFLSSGGVVGIMLNRQSTPIGQFRASPLDPGFNDFLAEWGLSQRAGLVVDPRCDRIQIQATQGAFRMINIVDYPYFPWVSDLDRKHPATKGLDGVSLPFVSPIDINAKAGITYTALARTSNLSYLDERPMDLNPLQTRVPPLGAPGGPFNAAVLAEKGTSRLIVIGTSHFIESDYPARPTNYSMFVNLLDWSVQDEALIQIRSKGFARRPLRELPPGLHLVLKYLMLFFLPIASVVIGLIVWQRQKTRRRLLPLDYQES